MKKSGVLATALLVITMAGAGRAEDKKPADLAIALAGGKVTMTAPEGWEKKKPRVRIIAYEFSAPAAKGDKIAARITFSPSSFVISYAICGWQAVSSSAGVSCRSP